MNNATTQNNTNQNQIHFKNFTNKFSLTKTLRFELVPDERTRRHLNLDAQNVQEVFPEEQTRQKARPFIKKYWDELIIEFITKALKEVQLSVSDIERVIAQERALQNGTSKEERQEKLKELWDTLRDMRSSLADAIESFSYELGDTEVTKKTILTKDFYKILEAKYADDSEAQRHLAAFAGMFTQLYDLLGNREHYFGKEGKHGQVATRVIDENLRTFAQNVLIYEKYYRDNLDLSDEERAIFTPEYYNNVLTQEGIDVYNAMIGGNAAEAGDVRTEGINNKVNEYNQTIGSQEGGRKLPFLQSLYSQIGTERDVRYEKIDSDEELYALLTEAANDTARLHERAREFFVNFFDDIAQYDLSKIYISKRSLRAIAQEIFSEWAALNGVFEKKAQYASLQAVKDYIDEYGDSFRTLRGKQATWSDFLAAWRHNVFARLDGGTVTTALGTEGRRQFVSLREKGSAFRDALTRIADGRLGDGELTAIREYLEVAVEVARLTTLFRVRIKKGKNQFIDLMDELTDDKKDLTFYTAWQQLTRLADEIRVQKIFNKVRNYLTHEDEKQDEVRVYFSPQFLGGWSESQINNKKAVILRKNGAMYLGVVKNNINFEDLYTTTSSPWKKMILKTLDFKTLMGKGFKNHYGAKFSDMSDPEALKKAREFLTEVRPQYLDDYPSLQSVLQHEYTNKADFREACTNALAQEKGFIFKNIDANLLEEKVQNGDLYLFKICNKDLCGNATGKRNVHTILWQTLFSDENMRTSPQRFMLLANGKIFFRDAQKEKHRKTLADGEQEVSRNDAPVYDAHRYTERKLLFHVPITINAHKDKIDDKTFSHLVNTELLQTPRAVLGIDRGEKHLLYWSLVDAEGNYIDSGSLNEINGTNYLALLEERERERREARQQWKSVGNITRLKEGYLSHVIHFIVSKALEYNAVIVLENLAFRFIQKRGGQFERSVYQQFQKALLQKLELVVDKDQEYAFDAPQLVSTATKRGAISLRDLHGQHGITFFLDPAYTSQTCPQCNWRKDFYLKYQSREQVIKDLKKRMQSIVFDAGRGAFALTYTREFDGSPVTVYSDVDRLTWDGVARQTLALSAQDITSALRAVLGSGAQEGELVGFTSAFDGLGVLDESGNDMLSELLKRKNAEKKAWQAFVYYFNRIMQIRNHYRAGEKGEADFIQCPKCGFDTRDNNTFLKNGDDLGAYNIARKGLIALEEVRNNPENPNLKINRQRWDEYLAKINNEN